MRQGPRNEHDKNHGSFGHLCMQRTVFWLYPHVCTPPPIINQLHVILALRSLKSGDGYIFFFCRKSSQNLQAKEKEIRKKKDNAKNFPYEK